MRGLRLVAKRPRLSGLVRLAVTALLARRFAAALTRLGEEMGLKGAEIIAFPRDRRRRRSAVLGLAVRSDGANRPAPREAAPRDKPSERQPR